MSSTGSNASRVEKGRWQRPIKHVWSDGVTSLHHIEYLDMDLVLKRFCDATHERGDASLRDRLLYAIDGDE